MSTDTGPGLARGIDRELSQSQSRVLEKILNKQLPSKLSPARLEMHFQTTFPEYCEFCPHNNNNIMDIVSNKSSLSTALPSLSRVSGSVRCQEYQYIKVTESQITIVIHRWTETGKNQIASHK